MTKHKLCSLKVKRLYLVIDLIKKSIHCSENRNRHLFGLVWESTFCLRLSGCNVTLNLSFCLSVYPFAMKIMILFSFCFLLHYIALLAINFFIQDILYFKVYLMYCFWSYYPPSCPLRDLPIVLAYFQSTLVLRRRLSCKLVLL